MGLLAGAGAAIAQDASARPRRPLCFRAGRSARLLLPLLRRRLPASQVAPIEGERDLRLPHDLSPWGMFMAADWVVKAVMIGLAIASLATWTVWVAKSLELAGARRRANKALKIIGHSATLNDAVHALDGAKGPGAAFVRAAEDDSAPFRPGACPCWWRGSQGTCCLAPFRIEAKAGRRLAKGTGILATIGSVAPFVGLFGTV